MRRCLRESEGIFFMGYVQGEGRTQATLFPLTLEELIPDDHVCRVIDAFVDRLDMAGLGFERAEAAETGRPGYDPRDLLKLYTAICSRSVPRGGWSRSADGTSS
jgi:transposase